MVPNAVASSSKLTKLRDWLESAGRSLWFGAVSFEDRCSGSLQALLDAGLTISEGLALDYNRGSALSTKERKLREQNWHVLQNYSGNVFNDGIRKIEFSAYSFQEIQQWLQMGIVDNGFSVVILDITCMTKIHALALAATVAQWPSSIKWTIAYSVPENYGHLNAKRSLGWKDIIVAPLADTAYLINESQGRGIVIPGHEADRLIVGLGELEPSGGVVIIADTPRRPDLRHLSERANQKIVRQLTRKRSAAWSKTYIGLHDTSMLSRCVEKEIELARLASAPVILFPYGPKSLLFLAALELSLKYPEASWFVYPIPFGYDLDYSEGVEQTFWLWPTAR